MRLRKDLPKSYGARFSELAIKYAMLIDALTTEAERSRIENIGDFIRHYNILNEGVKVYDKERNTISRQILGMSTPEFEAKIEDEKRKIRTNTKLIIEDLNSLETGNRTQKTLAEISEANTTADNLKKYLKEAKKDGVIEEKDKRYQLSKRGLETAYARFSLKDFHA